MGHIFQLTPDLPASLTPQLRVKRPVWVSSGVWSDDNIFFWVTVPALN